MNIKQGKIDMSIRVEDMEEEIDREDTLNIIEIFLIMMMLTMQLKKTIRTMDNGKIVRWNMVHSMMEATSTSKQHKLTSKKSNLKKLFHLNVQIAFLIMNFLRFSKKK